MLTGGLERYSSAGPLLQPGYFWGAHDARHDVYFLFQFDRSVQEGNWFPRWGPDWSFGYGYPFWSIYAPLSVMVGEAFHHFLGSLHNRRGALSAGKHLGQHRLGGLLVDLGVRDHF